MIKDKTTKRDDIVDVVVLKREVVCNLAELFESISKYGTLSLHNVEQAVWQDIAMSFRAALANPSSQGCTFETKQNRNNR